jgi:hypothetical protein
VKRVWKFVQAVAHHWGILTTGGVLIGALALWQNTGHYLSPKVEWVIAGIAVLGACFKAWNEQFERAESLVAEVQKPATPQRPKLEMVVSAEGHPPSQTLKLVANQPVTVSRIDYMLTSGASIAWEELSAQGESVELPINDSKLVQVWNIPRADRNNYDRSGPAKIGFTVSVDGQPRQYILPIQMQSVVSGSTMYRRVIGSKTFYSRAL